MKWLCDKYLLGICTFFLSSCFLFLGVVSFPENKDFKYFKEDNKIVSNRINFDGIYLYKDTSYLYDKVFIDCFRFKSDGSVEFGSFSFHKTDSISVQRIFKSFDSSDSLNIKLPINGYYQITDSILDYEIVSQVTEVRRNDFYEGRCIFSENGKWFKLLFEKNNSSEKIDSIAKLYIYFESR